MSEYVVYDNVVRKIVQTKNGYRYIVDYVCLEEKENGPNKYLAIGHETGTNKCYGWVELNSYDPVEGFVGYIESIDKIEKDEYIKNYEKKHP